MLRSGYQLRLAGGGMTRIVTGLMIGTTVALLVQGVVDLSAGHVFTRLFGLSRDGLSHWRWWQPVSYIFLHDGVWHLLMNMLGLYFFGREMEIVLGPKRFLRLYLGCGILAGIGWVLMPGSRLAVCVGASGAVFGVIAAFAALFPEREITLLVFFVLPVTMTARIMAILFGVLTMLFLVGGGGNIAHAAHLAGGVAGYLYGRRLVGGGGVRRSRGGGSGGGVASQWFSPGGVAGDTGHLRLIEDDDVPTEEDVDRILEKISGKGMRSLSRKERRILKRASEEKPGGW